MCLILLVEEFAVCSISASKIRSWSMGTSLGAFTSARSLLILKVRSQTGTPDFGQNAVSPTRLVARHSD
jgi:hypothetical protein